MSKTLTRAILLVLISTLGCIQTASASGVVPTINNICINQTTGVLRSLRISPIKTCATNEVKVRANKVCVNKLSGKLRHLATNVKQKCRRGEVKLVWNQSITAFVTTANSASTSTTLTSPLTSPLRTTTPAGTATSANVAAAPSRIFSYKLGDVGPGGGLIFFVDVFSQFDGFTYLEAAPVDLPATAWANNSVSCFDISNASTSCLDASIYQASQAASLRINAAKIGQGLINTTLIKTQMSPGTPTDNTGFAAGLADAHVYGAVSDWYLPSINELSQMYINLKTKGLGDFQETYYWSSTEFETGTAWFMLFSAGYFGNNAKSFRFSVRPIRSFG